MTKHNTDDADAQVQDERLSVMQDIEASLNELFPDDVELDLEVYEDADGDLEGNFESADGASITVNVRRRGKGSHFIVTGVLPDGYYE